MSSDRVSCCSGIDGRGQVRSAVISAGARATRRPGRLVRIPGQRAWVGTDNSPLPGDGEGPPRLETVKDFAIDPYAVTNSWFAEFVAETGYRTDAEAFGWSLVFAPFIGGAIPADISYGAPSWWRRVEGASWRYPEGPNASIDTRQDHPAVHVSWNDAMAFARWAGGRLPSEAEWETAARGGLSNARFPWGDREPDDSTFQPCNIWQGEFPVHNAATDGYTGTAPVDGFDPNNLGIYNIVGNTWEWCADAFKVRSLAKSARARNDAARVARERVLKGGSYLCHRSYCYRYRIAARSGVSPDSSTGHVGFRLVFDI